MRWVHSTHSNLVFFFFNKFRSLIYGDMGSVKKDKLFFLLNLIFGGLWAEKLSIFWGFICTNLIYLFLFFVLIKLFGFCWIDAPLLLLIVCAGCVL